MAPIIEIVEIRYFEKMVGCRTLLCCLSLLFWTSTSASPSIKCCKLSLTPVRGGSSSASSRSSPIKVKSDLSDESSGPRDLPGQIAPNLWDIMLLDLNHTLLVEEVAAALDVEYLGRTQVVVHLPVVGTIYGYNNRLMVNFNCRRKSVKSCQWYNVIFLCDTASPFSFLSEQAMSKLSGGDNILPHMIADIGDITLGFYLAQPTSHFAGVNVLGMDFLLRTDASILINKASNSFELSAPAVRK